MAKGQARVRDDEADCMRNSRGKRNDMCRHPAITQAIPVSLVPLEQTSLCLRISSALLHRFSCAPEEGLEGDDE